MASKHQLTGMTGVYLLAAELSKRGYIASPTSRSAEGADLLVAVNECRRAFAVQVKTNARTFGFWLLNRNAQKHKSRNLIYALVNLKREGPEFYLVPSMVVARNVRVSRPSPTRESVWYSIYRDDVKRYRDNWSIFDR